MKKIKFLAFGLSSLAIVAMTSCKSSDKADSQQNDEEAAVETVAVVQKDTTDYARLFADASKKSDLASDSTYAVTPSGLRFVVLKEGTGTSPQATDFVTVNYEGKLLDGTVFDSSFDRGEPAGFPLNRVIPGWTEGLQLMKEGGKTVFYIPAELAYGEGGVPGTIPPNSDLIFTVELLNVSKAN